MQAISLEGRTALVTGASRGIGAAIAHALDRAGARVALTARSGDALDLVAAQLINEPMVLAADLADPDEPARLAAEASERLGGVDVLVNNAAVAARAPTVELDAELVDRLYAVNVRAPLLLIAALVPQMIERGNGVIVSVSSASAVVGTSRRAAYAASKGAIDAPIGRSKRSPSCGSYSVSRRCSSASTTVHGDVPSPAGLALSACTRRHNNPLGQCNGMDGRQAGRV